MSKEKVAISISSDIMDYIRDMVDKRRFSSVSHGFELMAFEYIQTEQGSSENPVEKLERFTLTGIAKSAQVVKGTTGMVMKSPVGKAMKESTEKVQKSKFVQKMMETTDKVVDPLAKEFQKTSEKVKESPFGKAMKDSADKVKQSKIGQSVLTETGKVMDAAKGNEPDSPENAKGPRKINIGEGEEEESSSEQDQL